MLVILLLANFIVVSLLSCKSGERVKLSWLIILIGLVNLGFAAIHQLTLSLDGRPEYGSDALGYWNEVISVVSDRASAFSHESLLFKKFSYWICITSYGPHILLVRLGNICLMLLSLILVYKIMRHFEISPIYCLWAVGMIGLNGIVIWMVIRHLKDSIFCFLVVLYLWIIVKNIRGGIIGFIAVALSSVIFSGMIRTIRPWGFALAILLPTLIFAANAGRKKNILLLGAVVAGLFLFNGSIGRNVNYLALFVRSITKAKIVEIEGADSQNAVSQRLSPKTLTMAVARYLIGPGPWNGILGHLRFRYTTTLGNILIFFGALVWWYHFSYFGAVCLLNRGKLLNRSMIGFLTVALSMLALYSFVYLGGMETRFRATLYVFTYPVFGMIRSSYLEHLLPLAHRQKSEVFLFVSVFFVIASLSSYLELRALL